MATRLTVNQVFLVRVQIWEPYADVAQLAVRRSCKAKAGSSSLSIGTIFSLGVIGSTMDFGSISKGSSPLEKAIFA